jgi:hypothetical protein
LKIPTGLLEDVNGRKDNTRHTQRGQKDKQFWNSSEIDRGKVYTLNTHMDDRLLSWLGTATAITSGGVKQVLWAQFIKVTSDNIF